jgi:hypothetical protein
MLEIAKYLGQNPKIERQKWAGKPKKQEALKVGWTAHCKYPVIAAH